MTIAFVYEIDYNLIIRNPQGLSLLWKKSRLRSYSALNIGHFLRKIKNDSEDTVKKPQSKAERHREPLLGTNQGTGNIPNWISELLLTNDYYVSLVFSLSEFLPLYILASPLYTRCVLGR